MSGARVNPGRILLILVLAGAGAIAILLLWRRSEDRPWTRDGLLWADSIQVSSDVPGLVTRVLVTENQFVRAGTVLFIVDDERYAAQLEQADAAVARARARLTMASDEAPKDRGRMGMARADLRQSLANRRIAQINFDRSGVRARADGYVTGLSLRPGDYAAGGVGKFTLVDASSFHVVGYFGETALRRLQPGDRARIDVLGEQTPLWGHVDSLAAQIGGHAPHRAPVAPWIQVARPVPVRIAIDQAPLDVRLIAGRTVTVTLLPTGPGPAAPGLRLSDLSRRR